MSDKNTDEFCYSLISRLYYYLKDFYYFRIKGLKCSGWNKKCPHYDPIVEGCCMYFNEEMPYRCDFDLFKKEAESHDE